MFQFQDFVLDNLYNCFSHLFSFLFLFVSDYLSEVLDYILVQDSFLMSVIDSIQDPMGHLLQVVYDVLSSMHLDPFLYSVRSLLPSPTELPQHYDHVPSVVALVITFFDNSSGTVGVGCP
jgi:hypothetical protein